MSTSVLKKLINSTAESNISMRKQIKEQQMSLLRLEHRMKQKKLGSTTPRQNQLRIPPGKMIIKAKGKMVMRVRNDKAILDELTNTKHRADSDDEMTDKSSPKFDSKTAPNLIIQSSVQNATAATSVPPPHTAVQPPPHSHPPLLYITSTLHLDTILDLQLCWTDIILTINLCTMLRNMSMSRRPQSTKFASPILAPTQNQ